MKCIADSGSTKTDWYLSSGERTFGCQTQGINPIHQTITEITSILLNELAPQLPSWVNVSEVFFYGAGCIAEASTRVNSAIKEWLGENAIIHIGSDMLGAARALCQHREGIACILGTGANSCLYDGKSIVNNISPLGYILGDEGSAAYIGKRLVGDVLKHQLSQETCTLFLSETKLDIPTIIEKVYRQPMANRFLGQISQFCQHHRDYLDIHNFLIDCFGQFFIRNIANYHRTDLPIDFVGSIAWVYEPEIRKAASLNGYQVGCIMRTPMEGLVKYHLMN